MNATAELTERQKAHQEKRARLRELSKIAKLKIELEQSEMTVNEMLIFMYTDQENKEFHTINAWNQKGYKVKKGSQSFLIWGKPQPLTKENENADTNEEDADDFFPLCYLFSNAQVEKNEA